MPGLILTVQWTTGTSGTNQLHTSKICWQLYGNHLSRPTQRKMLFSFFMTGKLREWEISQNASRHTRHSRFPFPGSKDTLPTTLNSLCTSDLYMIGLSARRPAKLRSGHEEIRK